MFLFAYRFMNLRVNNVNTNMQIFCVYRWSFEDFNQHFCRWIYAIFSAFDQFYNKRIFLYTFHVTNKIVVSTFYECNQVFTVIENVEIQKFENS